MTVKKKSKKTDNWQSCGWLIPVNYTSGELNSIAKSIFDRHYSGKSTLTINSIKNAASLFLSMKECAEEKPLPSDVKLQLKKLDNSVSNLLDAFVLDEPAMDIFQLYADELTEDPHFIDTAQKTLKDLSLVTFLSETSFNPRGRPKDEANDIFLLHLAKIWETVRGEIPKHEQMRSAVDEYDQPFYHFVAAVCDPIPLASEKQITHRRVKTFLQEYQTLDS